MKVLGLQVKAPNPAIREMAQNGLIDNPEKWFEFILARNKTSHSYDEDIAEEVYQEIVLFIPELDKLINKLARDS
jgi:nucleotidyltransferase substrate binding protein (TIGR01987 family)